MPILPAATYARAVTVDREIADVIAVNDAHGCLTDPADRDAFTRDRQRAWRDAQRARAVEAGPLLTLEFCSMCDDVAQHTGGKCDECGHRAAIA